MAEDAYLVFCKCNPPPEWQEREFFFLLQSAWEPKSVDPNLPYKVKNQQDELNMRFIYSSSACWLGELFGNYPDETILILSAFRRLQERWMASPEKRFTLTIALNEWDRRQEVGAKQSDRICTGIILETSSESK
ncbi:MAG: hypothetical protein ABIQ35_05870 [Verrucomicrobiota bacterium]